MLAIKLIQSDDGQLLYKPCEVEPEDQNAQPIDPAQLMQALPQLFEQAKGYAMEEGEEAPEQGEEQPQMEGEEDLQQAFANGFQGVRGGNSY